MSFNFKEVNQTFQSGLGPKSSQKSFKKAKEGLTKDQLHPETMLLSKKEINAQLPIVAS